MVKLGRPLAISASTTTGTPARPWTLQAVARASIYAIVVLLRCVCARPVAVGELDPRPRRRRSAAYGRTHELSQTSCAGRPRDPSRGIRHAAPGGSEAVPADRSCAACAVAIRCGDTERPGRDRLCAPPPRSQDAPRRRLRHRTAVRRRLPGQRANGRRWRLSGRALSGQPRRRGLAAPAAAGAPHLVGAQLSPPARGPCAMRIDAVPAALSDDPPCGDT